MSRYAIAQQTGISQPTLGRFAAGTTLSGDHLDALADFLGMVLVHRDSVPQPQKTKRQRKR